MSFAHRLFGLSAAAYLLVGICVGSPGSLEGFALRLLSPGGEIAKPPADRLRPPIRPNWLAAPAAPA
jgi:hypothetical protein